MCETLDWRLGQMWVVDPDGATIRCRYAWSVPGEDYAEFIEASRNIAFLPGQGMPGRAWQAKAPRVDAR